MTHHLALTEALTISIFILALVAALLNTHFFPVDFIATDGLGAEFCFCLGRPAGHGKVGLIPAHHGVSMDFPVQNHAELAQPSPRARL